jgi:hypothetical protein
MCHTDTCACRSSGMCSRLPMKNQQAHLLRMRTFLYHCVLFEAWSIRTLSGCEVWIRAATGDILWWLELTLRFWLGPRCWTLQWWFHVQLWTEKQAMKWTWMGAWSIALCIINFCTRRRWVVSFMPLPLCPPVPIGLEAGWVPEPLWTL